jgi:hypothetical protein
MRIMMLKGRFRRTIVKMIGMERMLLRRGKAAIEVSLIKVGRTDPGAMTPADPAKGN